jgi:uncharacterized protein (DUF1684 family)
MPKTFALLPLLLTCFLAAAVQAQDNDPKSLEANTPYQKQIADWQAKRIHDLKTPNGWLNLVGLYWLEPGQNTFGTASTNKIIFPAGTIANTAGSFERSGNTVRLVVADGVTITVNGKNVKEAVIYEGDSTRPPVVASGRLRWTVIRRDDKIGIRLRDTASPLLTQFKGIDRFPVDTTWRITATLKTTTQPTQISIKNILGQTSQQQTPGKLVFTIGAKEYTLDALQEGDELFIIFGDETCGKSTYPSGRFLSVRKPGADGTTTIDFNKAYNPPCAFTNYATCPIPPPQNILPVAITAGEKNYGHHKIQ